MYGYNENRDEKHIGSNSVAINNSDIRYTVVVTQYGYIYQNSNAMIFNGKEPWNQIRGLAIDAAYNHSFQGGAYVISKYKSDSF